MKEPTRGELISLCERAFVAEDLWRNRDSASAQRQLGECYALLRAGCSFTFADDIGPKGQTDVWWVRVESKGFAYFEYEAMDSESYYIPTAKRLDEVDGGDWYC